MRGSSLRDRLRLIVIADPSATTQLGLIEVIRIAVAAGAPAIQLRAKGESTRSLVELGRELRAATRERGVLLFVNDRVDVALTVEADGAHLGDDDLPLAAARSMVPHGFILGRSVDTPEEVPAAISAGADYLGVGPVRVTSTKLDVGAPIGTRGVALVAAAAGEVPVVGIGGIRPEDAFGVTAAGAAGVAVISSVMAASDPHDAVRTLLSEAERGRAASLDRRSEGKA